MADLSAPLHSALLYFPQIVDGGGYQTTLLFMNTSNEQEAGTVRFTDNPDSPLAVSLSAGGAAASQDRRFIAGALGLEIP